jgi:5'-nucleotidase
MRILISNDDGIHAAGLCALAAAMSELGEVYVVAPAVERSAVSHALTLFEPIWIEHLPAEAGAGEKLRASLSGTPADCVKLAIRSLMPEPPDIVLSGINRGANCGNNILYSGTVAAATEGALAGIPAIALSVASFEFQDYEGACWIARELVRELHGGGGLPPGVLLNVNLPPLPRAELRGVRITRQGRARFAERYLERRDPRHRTYFWMEGERDGEPEPPGADESAVAAGYVSITPIRFEVTAWDGLGGLAERLAGCGAEPAPGLPRGL